MASVNVSLSVRKAARLLATARHVLVTSGAGMGVDSGLSDFRGREGFWNAYPAFKNRGISFQRAANPAWFASDPELAWAFYGHRLQQYRNIDPHAGFGIIREWGKLLNASMFGFTSNVDGHWYKSGWAKDKIVECHGSIHHIYCCNPWVCGEAGHRIESADQVQPNVDMESFRASPDSIPVCPCGDSDFIARPNVLMFGDGDWVSTRTEEQHERFRYWAKEAVRAGALGEHRVAVVEIGAGTAVPTVRVTGESMATRSNGSLIRINPRDTHIPSGMKDESTVAVATGCLEAVTAIDQELRRLLLEEQHAKEASILRARQDSPYPMQADQQQELSQQQQEPPPQAPAQATAQATAQAASRASAGEGQVRDKHTAAAAASASVPGVQADGASLGLASSVESIPMHHLFGGIWGRLLSVSDAVLRFWSSAMPRVGSVAGSPSSADMDVDPVPGTVDQVDRRAADTPHDGTRHTGEEMVPAYPRGSFAYDGRQRFFIGPLPASRGGVEGCMHD